jgi:hypothetical protein
MNKVDSTMQFPSDQTQVTRYSEVNDLVLLKASTKSISINAKLKNFRRLSEMKSVVKISCRGSELLPELAKAISSAPMLNSHVLSSLREFCHPISSPSLTKIHVRSCSGLSDFAFVRAGGLIKSRN